MSIENEYATVDLPGPGEIRARKGTSTLELAGAAKHWHDKSKSAYIDGFTGGGVVGVLISLATFGVYYLLAR